MSMKTNKSYMKRIRITKNGKLVTRKAGQNHFNAKESRRAQLAKKRASSFPFPISNKDMSRLFVNGK
jgi:ribosomal protein L35